jgi:hypothetical protein
VNGEDEGGFQDHHSSSFGIYFNSNLIIPRYQREIEVPSGQTASIDDTEHQYELLVPIRSVAVQLKPKHQPLELNRPMSGNPH